MDSGMDRPRVPQGLGKVVPREFWGVAAVLTAILTTILAAILALLVFSTRAHNHSMLDREMTYTCVVHISP
jgi:hypothetical protein